MKFIGPGKRTGERERETESDGEQQRGREGGSEGGSEAGRVKCHGSTPRAKAPFARGAEASEDGGDGMGPVSKADSPEHHEVWQLPLALWGPISCWTASQREEMSTITLTAVGNLWARFLLKVRSYPFRLGVLFDPDADPAHKESVGWHLT